MQPIQILAQILEKNASPDHALFSVSDFFSVFPDFTPANLRVLLCRAAKKGLLEHICYGVYRYPKVAFDCSRILYRVALKLRAQYFNYISLESVLCDASIISQQLMGYITVMTKGRSGIVSCGKYGTVELIHTKKAVTKLLPDLTMDFSAGMWRASPKRALQDMKDAKRSLELVNDDLV